MIAHEHLYERHPCDLRASNEMNGDKCDRRYDPIRSHVCAATVKARCRVNAYSRISARFRFKNKGQEKSGSKEDYGRCK